MSKILDPAASEAQVIRASITPTCRVNRGDVGAFEMRRHERELDKAKDAAWSTFAAATGAVYP